MTEYNPFMRARPGQERCTVVSPTGQRCEYRKHPSKVHAALDGAVQWSEPGGEHGSLWPDQFCDQLAELIQRGIGPDGLGFGWTVRPLHETERGMEDEGLEVRTPRGTFLVLVQEAP